MTAGAEYVQARHVQQVQAAAREGGIKGAAYAVLSYLCSVSDFKKPITRASKDKIEQRLGYCDKTIKAALATLRAAGYIEPVAFATGGRGLCPVYVLRTRKGGENFPPITEADLVKGGKKLPEKGGKNFPKRGEKTSPPSEYSSNTLSDHERAAFSRGGQSRHLDAGQGPRTVAAASLTDQERGFVAALADDLKTMSYGEARRKDKARRAAAETAQGL